jgi:hypothetical protein
MFLCGCSLNRGQNLTPARESQTVVYNYTDQTGSYLLKREVKYSNKKIITRTKIFSNQSNSEVESTVAVSILGTVRTPKNRKIRVLLPNVSQFKVWFSKKEHFSQVKLNRKSKQVDVLTKNPEKKGNFEQSFSIPKGRFFCFFSQLPECLKEQNLLYLSAQKKVQLFVVWDNFPYHSELYEGMGTNPITSATLEISKHSKDELKYSLDIGNQIIFYHFDKKLMFKGFYWISQGISLKRSS